MSASSLSGRAWFLSTLALVAISAGCAVHSGEETDRVGLRAETSLPSRAGTVIVDGCVIDPWQKAVLAGPGAHRMLQTVVLLCLVPRLDGTIGPRDPSAVLELGRTADLVHGLGYRAHFAVAFTDETGQRYDGSQTGAFLKDPAWRARFVSTLPPVIEAADGLEIDLQGLTDETRASVTALVTETSKAVRPAKKLGVFIPPSVTTPSDLPGGEAFDRRALSTLVDRMRVMTLDFSESQPGPTIEPGWAVDAARVALRDTTDGAAAIDVAYPLYGMDWGPRGRRSITWFDAMGMAQASRAPIERGPTGAPNLRYGAFGEPHILWFDDAESTARALGAWTTETLPSGVGVVFYGLGAEDPQLFELLGARYP